MTITAIDHVHGKHIGAVYLTEEGTFGVPAVTPVRACVVADSCELVPSQTVVTPMCLSSVPYDPEPIVLGDKSVTVAVSHYLQPPAGRLDSAAVVPTVAQAPLRVPLAVLFGGESLAAGSDVDSAASASSITVTTTHGARFPAGQIVCVDAGGSVGLEVAQVRSRAGDVVTLYPALTSAPSVGADVINTVCYYPSRTNARSLSVAFSGRNTSRQWRALGCTGNAQFKFEKNALAVAEFALVGATFEGPDTLGLPVDRAADPMAAPLAVRNAVCWLQPTATTTRAQTPVEAVSVTCSFGMTHLTSLTGTLDGERGVMRSDKLNEAFARIELVLPDNADVYTWFNAQTALSFTFFAVSGAPSQRRVVGFHVPQCTIVEYVPPQMGEGNLVKAKVVLSARLSEQCAGTLDNEELAQAPFVLFLG